MTAGLVALGALAGAPARHWVSRHLDSESWPAGTLLVNVLGSLLLGVLTGLSLTGDALALLGTGFAGAFTTYSSFALQAHDLGPRRGSAYAAVTLALGVGACCVGFWAAAQA